MTNSSLTVDLIDGFDRLSLNLLSKSSPSSVSTFQVNHSQQPQGTSIRIQDINTSPLPTKSNTLNNKANLSHVPCKFFKQGTCTAGANCTFSHNLTPTSEASVCKYFLKGNCKFGTKCALLHTMSFYNDDRKLLVNRNIINGNNTPSQQQENVSADVSSQKMAFSLGSINHNNNNNININNNNHNNNINNHSKNININNNTNSNRNDNNNSSQWVNRSSFITKQRQLETIEGNINSNKNNYLQYLSTPEGISSTNEFSSQLTAAIQQQEQEEQQHYYNYHQDITSLNQMYNHTLLTTNSSPRDSILVPSYDYNISTSFQNSSNNNNNNLMSMNRLKGLNNDDSNNSNINNDINNGFSSMLPSSSSFLHSISETSASLAHYSVNKYQLNENYVDMLSVSKRNDLDFQPPLPSSFHDQFKISTVHNQYSNSYDSSNLPPKLVSSLKNNNSNNNNQSPYFYYEPSSAASEISRAYSSDTPQTNYFDLFGSSNKSFISPQNQYINGNTFHHQGNEKWSESSLIGSFSSPGYSEHREVNYQQHYSIEKNNTTPINAINIPSNNNIEKSINNEKNDTINNSNNTNINNLFNKFADQYTSGSLTQNNQMYSPSFKETSSESLFILGSKSIDLSQQIHQDYSFLKTTTPPTPSITTPGTFISNAPLNEENDSDPFYMEDTDISQLEKQQNLEDLGYMPPYSSIIRPT